MVRHIYKLTNTNGLFYKLHGYIYRGGGEPKNKKFRRHPPIGEKKSPPMEGVLCDSGIAIWRIATVATTPLQNSLDELKVNPFYPYEVPHE